MAQVDALQEAALEYLAACVAALDALVPAGAPERRFVSHGPPAWDCCPMLAVHVGTEQEAATRVGTGALAPMHRVALTGVVGLVTLTATVLRCTPTTEDGTPVDADLLTAAAATTNADLWAIRNWLVSHAASGDLFGGVCREFEISLARALAVEGLCAGWEITIRISLDGFNPAA